MCGKSNITKEIPIICQTFTNITKRQKPSWPPPPQFHLVTWPIHLPLIRLKLPRNFEIILWNFEIILQSFTETLVTWPIQLGNSPARGRCTQPYKRWQRPPPRQLLSSYVCEYIWPIEIKPLKYLCSLVTTNVFEELTKVYLNLVFKK
jgi:hypothetical protein